MTNSSNYRGIALCSMYNKLFDLILLFGTMTSYARVIYSLAATEALSLKD